MNFQKITFENKDAQVLSGRLELPIDQYPHNFVLFAHCFTCTKNLLAVKHISRELSARGFGVLRFDFTGLGESEGDFSESNFSGNVTDLTAASKFLETNYQAPTLLIGHSLGGAAVLFAATEIPSVRAIVTIGAPSDPTHVKRLLKSSIGEIKEKGIARVHLSGRDFTIKKQFLDDLESRSLPETANKLRKPLLIMHSPQDKIVDIKNAEEIYNASHHPKSFISLDGADHLLSNKDDSTYVGKVISEWALRYLEKPKQEALQSRYRVVASLDGDAGFTTQLKLGNHNFTADEPTEVGGNDFGPSPYELVAAGLAACTAMTIQMYAKRKNWKIPNIEVHISHHKIHAEDCEECESSTAKIDTFHREIKINAELDDTQLSRLLEIADKCPVHKTLHSKMQIITNLLK